MVMELCVGWCESILITRLTCIGRQPTGISLVGLHNLVRGATACKYNEFRPKAYIIGKRIRLRKSGICVEKKAAFRSDLPLSTHVVLKTTHANPKDYVRRY